MNLREKLKKRLAIGFAIYLLLTFIGLVYYNSKGINDRMSNFYNHKIIGEISAIAKANSRIEIQFVNDKNKYAFFQKTESYLKNDFYKSVNAGDSLFKEAHSDTILIRSSNHSENYIIEYP